MSADPFGVRPMTPTDSDRDALLAALVAVAVLAADRETDAFVAVLQEDHPPTDSDRDALRTDVLKALAISDGQTWARYAAGTTGEIMYGRLADAVMAVVTPTLDAARSFSREVHAIAAKRDAALAALARVEALCDSDLTLVTVMVRCADVRAAIAGPAS